MIAGSLKRIVISNPDGATSEFEFFLERPDGVWTRLLTESVPEDAVNREVTVSGESMEDGKFAVREIEIAGGPADDVGDTTQALVTPTPKKVLLLLFNFTSNTAQPLDVAAARSMLFTGATSVNSYFKEVSFGARSIVGKNQADGDVVGYVTIENSTAGCDYSAWGTAARAKAQAEGVDLNGYDHIVHYFPRTTSCAFSGVAQLPGRYSWINGSGSQTTAHELGHNFGIHHASSYICTLNGARVPVGGTCTLDEYGDPFDVMGRGYRHISAYQKGRLGWLEAANTRTVTASGDFEVSPLEVKTDTGIQSLRVAIPGTTEFYYVEMRKIFGFDSFRSTDPVAGGVLIHRATDYPKLVRPALVDNVPSTTSFTDAALGVERTFTDSAANLSITLMSRTESSASVRVSFGGGGNPGTGGAPGSGGSTGSGGTGSGGAGGTSSGGTSSGGTSSGGTSSGGTSSGGTSSGGAGGTGGVGTGGTGTGGTGPVACGSGETAFDGRCYWRNTSSRSYSQAQTQCTSRGSGWHLATIGSAAENAFVSSLAGSYESWIGARDSAAEGTWVWATGATFWTGGLSGSPSGGAYANFMSGEPNDSGDCLRIVSGGTWRDVSCSSSYRSVCEKN